MKRVFIASAVAAAFAAGAPAVFAQDVESPTDTPTLVAAAPAADAAPQRTMRERRARMSASDRVEARLAYVKTALKITDAQQAQWESFANVLRKHAKAMDERFQQHRAEAPRDRAQRAERRSPSAIDRLERTQQRMAARSARLSEVVAAAKPLYAALSPEQQQVADGLIARQGRGHHRGMRHRGHRGGQRGA